MKRLFIFIALLLIGSLTFAQQSFDSTTKKRAMSRLSMLAGTWEGSGWASAPDGSRQEFVQSEIIEEKLDGIALLVHGLGKSKESGEIIHNALAIITYNETDSLYSFQSHLSTGQSTTAEGYFEDESFIWRFEVPGGQVKYTLRVTEDSKWNETGQFSRDGNHWYQFIEMNLVKVDVQ